MCVRGRKYKERERERGREGEKERERESNLHFVQLKLLPGAKENQMSQVVMVQVLPAVGSCQANI